MEAVTAVPLPDDLRKRIVEEHLPEDRPDVHLTESVDPEIVGGLVLRIGGAVVDGSVRHRIDELREALGAAPGRRGDRRRRILIRPTTDLSREATAQMKLRPDEITKVLRGQIEQYSGTVDVEEVGTVLQVGDGIARIHGLESCVSLEMLEFPHGVTGLALNLEEDNVGAVLLGDDSLIK